MRALPSELDPWLARDKAEHFAFCFAITSAVYLGSRSWESLRRHRLLLACFAGLAAGLAKELGDWLQWWPGVVSARDLGADLAGVALALAALVAAEAGAALPMAQPDRGAAAIARGEQPGGGLERRRFEVAGLAVELRQDMRGSGALRPLDDDRVWADGGGEIPPILTADELERVGLVVWQAGFVLADLLLRRPPFGSWHGAAVLDLGCGTGLVGILLALAGAEVVLSDQPHITPLAEENMRANLTPGLHRACVVDYTWGQGDAAATLLQRPPAAGSSAAPAAATDAPAGSAPLPASAAAAAGPPAPCFDVITAADVVYQPACYADLAATLRQLAAPHTLVYVAYKKRGLQESSFLDLLEGVGFAVQEVPQAQLAAEYRSGSYRVLRACRIE
ncbi:hypothetical protein CHLNCDRAFT_138545 [Chlorella variabilis]|uniref:Methyltransferase small domain-containing protein n=1 Tax=Chlorella variabilis TaxID=554065 RepID=E1ZN92_CHLVA|nr:hypothetical protein CHLNCDRAFT_138545 [Chlorella variabilis]EFN52560.1 hypothetical protein CHLNCDRAFT_138545 [Chlorella variabilis]|eukprot:XP_005844662.1 hypothetical protein CHLNCDRAFT_138545 [Chlorella variabilis]